MILDLILAFAMASEAEPRHPLARFTLEESASQLLGYFDRPPQVASGRNFTVLQFHALAPTVVEAGLPVEWIANTNTSACDGKYSYSVYLDENRRVQSILHQPDRRLPLSILFEPGSYEDYEVANSAGLRFRYRVRALSSDRFLVTTLLQPDAKYLEQVVLIRASAIPGAFPLLAAKLQK